MMQDSYRPFGNAECLDVFTHYAALEYLKTKKPKVLYISYGETDEWAHHGYYRSYLDAAHLVDKWIKEIWTYVQSDPQYKNKTAIFITTDHGRGDINKNEWTDHGSGVADAYEIWFAAMGTSISSSGEQKNNVQLFQDQFAQTIAKLLGVTYKASHPISPEIKSVLKK
jgi:bisphosphoglycerate-independent phosphoglycerate mutase (AlkP superfamily)